MTHPAVLLRLVYAASCSGGPVIEKCTMKSCDWPALVLLGWLTLAGCQGGSGTEKVGGNLGSTAKAGEPLAAAPGKRVAIVDGQEVSMANLQASLAEVGGAVALEEFVIDSRLARMAQEAGVRLDDEAVQRERLALIDSVARGSDLSPEQAVGFVDRFRRARGLGPKRFDALLKRNGLMRAIVASEVAVTQAEVDEAIRAATGPRVLARIVVTPAFATASAAAQRVRAAGGLEARKAIMALIASSDSIDASAARGGQIGPMSAADPALVSTLRTALSLPVGEVSDVFAIEGSFAVLLVEDVTPAPADANAVDPEAVRAQIRLRKEREAMDRLGAALLGQGRVIVTDEGLRWAWESRPGG